MIRIQLHTNYCWLLISVFFMLPFCGCSENESPASFSFDNSTVNLAVRSLKEKNIDGQKNSFLYGYVEIISNDKPLSSFDLNCLTLKVEKKVSNGVYVDSIAHVLKENFKANEQGEIKVSIYWVFDHLNGMPKNSSLELVLDDEKFRSCRQ